MGGWHMAQRQIARLTPVAEVAARLVANKTMVGLHVRTVFDAPRDDATARTALGKEAVRAAVSEYGTEGARQLLQWRKASHWSQFVPHIAALLRVEASSVGPQPTSHSPPPTALLPALYAHLLAHAPLPPHCYPPTVTPPLLPPHRLVSQEDTTHVHFYLAADSQDAYDGLSRRCGACNIEHAVRPHAI